MIKLLCCPKDSLDFRRCLSPVWPGEGARLNSRTMAGNRAYPKESFMLSWLVGQEEI